MFYFQKQITAGFHRFIFDKWCNFDRKCACILYRFSFICGFKRRVISSFGILQIFANESWWI